MGRRFGWFVLQSCPYFSVSALNFHISFATDVLHEVTECFSADTVAECRRRVEAVASSGRPGVQVGDWVQDNWAVRALAQWNTISDPALVEVSTRIYWCCECFDPITCWRTCCNCIVHT